MGFPWGILGIVIEYLPLAFLVAQGGSRPGRRRCREQIPGSSLSPALELEE
jgi:hypothetical protein